MGGGEGPVEVAAAGGAGDVEDFAGEGKGGMVLQHGIPRSFMRREKHWLWKQLSTASEFFWAHPTAIS